MYRGMLLPDMISSTSGSTDSAPSSGFQPLTDSHNMILWGPSWVIWTPTLPSKVSDRSERSPPCSSTTLPPTVASKSFPLPWRIFLWSSSWRWAPYMWWTCHTWERTVGSGSSPPWSLPCPARGIPLSVAGVCCGLSPYMVILPLGKSAACCLW